MITETDKRKIREISKKYHAKRVVLFGSSISSSRKSCDIDLAVEGVAARDFYKFYGDLMFSLSKPVDVIDLSGTSKFIRMINQEGMLLYG